MKKNEKMFKFKVRYLFLLLLFIPLFGQIFSDKTENIKPISTSSTPSTLLQSIIDTSNSSKINSSAIVGNATKVETNEKTSTLVSPSEVNENSVSSSTISSSVEKKIIINSTTAPSTEQALPDSKAVENEHNSSLSIFFVLCVIALGILLIHMMLQTGFQYLPESIVVVFLGALIGLTLKIFVDDNRSSWKREEVFSPTGFFLVLLPPIIFESGYNLHKGNFFQNIGSILVFAIFGTTISALVIGAGIYLLGIAEVAYRLNFYESFAFGSLISAVDPVATVAIFHALDVDPVLNMLVFGESILNDAISIVLTTTISAAANSPAYAQASTSEAIMKALQTFCAMFFASAGIGVVFALISALLLKHIDLRKHPSLEFAMMLVFTYAPYVLAEGIHLSGIMAILFCGIVMSHYTHFNLSTVTQITMQQTMRTLSFIAETCVFAYLGLAIFSFKHQVEMALVVWSIILCLIGRACNIFPLAFLVNKFREHKITNKMQFIMWFSGLRGAISYALSLHLELSSVESRHVIITTTLIIVLFTTLFFGGSTMPLLKYLQPGKKLRRSSRRRGGPGNISSKRRKEISLSKTRKWGNAIDSEHLSELTEEEDVTFAKVQGGIGFGVIDRKYFTPFFTRRFTSQELHDCKSQMADLTNKWYQAIRVSPQHTEDEDENMTNNLVNQSKQHHQQQQRTHKKNIVPDEKLQQKQLKQHENILIEQNHSTHYQLDEDDVTLSNSRTNLADPAI
ncbi:sodium/hydrogen exchanger 8 [Condylostylus longicornis]|uniref:sodium/hydrogen exchanger 8 n=1 Tax=Condylostylus longicornis TaxID=2530218 RepID=UPI00244E0E6F|nr:sodium/hydrogen exchanger 8 [Condylostylus longicornis]